MGNQEFPAIDIPDDITKLPFIDGSGVVRNLWEAAALNPELKNLLIQFNEDTTVAEQIGLIENLLHSWATTSSSIENIDDRISDEYKVIYSGLCSDKDNFLKKLYVLEGFTGTNFFTLPIDLTAGQKLPWYIRHTKKMMPFILLF